MYQEIAREKTELLSKAFKHGVLETNYAKQFPKYKLDFLVHFVSIQNEPKAF